MKLAALLFALATSTACSPKSARLDSAQSARTTRIRAEMEMLRPLYDRAPEPESGDWLASHEEPGQTLEQYWEADPRMPDAARKIIYVQPLGEFSPGQRSLVAKTAEFLGIAYSLAVRMRPNVSLRTVPPDAERTRPGSETQVLTPYVLETLLAPKLPLDAVAMIALTASDLWPGAGWNGWQQRPRRAGSHSAPFLPGGLCEIALGDGRRRGAPTQTNASVRAT